MVFKVMILGFTLVLKKKKSSINIDILSVFFELKSRPSSDSEVVILISFCFKKTLEEYQCFPTVRKIRVMHRYWSRIYREIRSLWDRNAKSNNGEESTSIWPTPDSLSASKWFILRLAVFLVLRNEIAGFWGGGVKLENLWNKKRPKSTLLASNTRVVPLHIIYKYRPPPLSRI